MNGISDQCLESTKNQVLATADLKAMFEAASNFLAEALDNKVSYAGGVVRRARITTTNSNNHEWVSGRNPRRERTSGRG